MSDDSVLVNDKGEARDKGGEYGGLAGTMGSAEHRDEVKSGDDDGKQGDAQWHVDNSVQTRAGAHESVERKADPTTSAIQNANDPRDAPIPAPDSGRMGDSAPEIEAREHAPRRKGATGTEANDAF